MHIVLLGDAQFYTFQVEHDQLEREGRRQRLAREARRIAKASKAEQPAVRGFIPRLAGALGLF